MRKILMLCLLFWNSLYFSSNVFAEMRKANFNLPEPDKNWIVSAYVDQEIVVIYHRLGVAISHDQGRSFFAAAFSGTFKPASGIPFVRIDRNNNKIFLDAGDLFISNDLGISFQKSDLTHYESLNGIAFDGQDLYVSKNFDTGHDICDKNLIMHSTDGGKSFKNIYYGEGTYFNTRDIYLNQGTLYVSAESGLYKTENKGLSFQKIATNNPTWQEHLASKNALAIFFDTKWSTIGKIFPTAKIFSAGNTPNYHVQYINSSYRATTPTPGVFYKLEDQNAFISSDLAARMGGITSDKKVYYASFKDVWIEE